MKMFALRAILSISHRLSVRWCYAIGESVDKHICDVMRMSKMIPDSSLVFAVTVCSWFLYCMYYIELYAAISFVCVSMLKDLIIESRLQVYCLPRAYLLTLTATAEASYLERRERHIASW